VKFLIVALAVFAGANANWQHRGLGFGGEQGNNFMTRFADADVQQNLGHHGRFAAPTICAAKTSPTSVLKP